MPRKGKDFELLIKKFEILKNIGAKIKSPEYVLDADTNTRREVDIGIHFNNSSMFIAIECRDRGGIQDIQWIEQLITKKNSINANVLIAVTASSFTEPAKQKAFKNGILIRRIENISTDDIISLKGTSYLEANYISNLNYVFDSILLYDSSTEISPHLELVHLQNCFVYNQETNEKIHFSNFINNVVIDGILKLENLDKQKTMNCKLEFKFDKLLLWPFNYEIKNLVINASLKIEKIKYPLVSLKVYKDSITYDLLGQIQEYGIQDTNFIIDKPSNTSSWQIDLSALQKPDKIFFSSIVYNENPTKLQNVTIKN